MEKPKAKLIINAEAARKADELFSAELRKNPILEKELGGAKLHLTDPLHYPLRKMWMGFYKQAGGKTELIHVCLRRRPVFIIPVEIDTAFQKQVDARFYERHPDLKGFRLPPPPEMPEDPKERERWSTLRNEWLDIFESLGGETVVIAGLETGTPVRIPKV